MAWDSIGLGYKNFNWSSGWSIITKIIGVIQIIICIVDIVKTSSLILDIILMEGVTWETTLHKTDQQNVILGILVLLVLTVLLPGIIMGIILLLGSHWKRPGYLKAWTVFATLIVFLFIGLAFYGEYTVLNFARIPLLLMAILFVQLHRKEFEKESLLQGQGYDLTLNERPVRYDIGLGKSHDCRDTYEETVDMTAFGQLHL